MLKIKALLTKLFPSHDGGTAAFISAILLTTVLISGIFLHDYFVKGHQYAEEVKFNIGAVCVFLGAAGATYVFGKRKNREI